MVPPTEKGDGAPEQNQPTLIDERRLDNAVQPSGLSAGDASSAGDAPLPLSRVGEYELLREIGRGGMGVVFHARHVRLGRQAALKMILGGALAAREDLHRFETEAAAAAQLQHPGIVALFDSGTHGDQPYFAMEYVAGASLAQRLQLGPIAPRRAAGYLEAVARAVHYAHSRGIVHRDLKPANVLLDDHDQPKVTDFGLAKMLATDSGQTRTGAVLGTPSYMAPEQAAGRKDIGPACDVWSLGAILYELLTGRPPFRGETALATLQKVADQEPLPPRVLDSSVDPDLETICLKCLEKDPARRYSSAGALADDLRRLLDGDAIVARRQGVIGRTVKYCRRRPTVAALILVASSAVLSLLLFFIAAAREERALRGEAEKAQRLALVREEAMRHLLYHAEMRRAQQALEQADVERVRRLLDRWRPRENMKDLRDWEWHFLHARTHGRFVLDAHPYQVSAVLWRPDGKQLFTAGGQPNMPGTIKVWDAATGKLVRTLEGHTRSITSLAFHPERNLIASGSFDKTVMLWDISAGKAVATLRGHASEVRDVAFSASGQRLASAGRDGTVRLWNVSDILTGKAKATVLRGHEDEVAAVAFAPKGDTLASASKDRTVRLWDTAAGKLRHTLRGHDSSVECVAFSRDGATLASGGGSGQKRGEVRLWEPATGALMTSHFGLSDRVLSLSFSKTGKLAAATGDGVVRVWDQARTSESFLFRGDKHINQLAFDPAGGVIAVAGQSGRVALFNAGSGLESLMLPSPGPVETLAFNPVGAFVASGGRGAPIRVWNLDHPDEAILLAGGGAAPSALAFAPDGNTLASGGEDNLIRLHDFRSPDQPPRTLTGHSAAVRALVFPADGKTLVSAGDDDTVRLWDVASGELRHTFKMSNSIRALAVSPDGRWLAAGGYAKTIRVWPLPPGRGMNEVNPADVPGDGFDLAGHTGTVNALVFSPDSHHLVSGSSDKSIRLWDVANREAYLQLDGATSAVLALAFHPGGRRLASVGQDRAVRLWDVITRQEILEFEDAAGASPAIAFSRDGRRLAATAGGGVRVWDSGAEGPRTK
jgi:eukaryotic-like serine/threonine-protein kinase